MSDRRIGLICCAFALATIAGCGRKAPPAVVTRSGVVDLDQLTPMHPGWRNIGQFDEAIAEVRKGAAGDKSVLGDVSLDTLPAIDISAPSRPDVGLDGERRRLEALGARQLALLRARSAEERDLQLRRESRTWKVEAEQQYQTALLAIENRYAAEYDRIIAEQTQEKLNLMLQIRALKDTIDHWKLSTPPAPELLQARQDLVDKQARYDAADTTHLAAIAAARSQRANEIRDALQARADYVAQKYAALETSLKAEDARQAEREALRLHTEREGLLAQIGAAETTSAPLVGALSAQTVREAGIAGASNARDLAAGEQRIAAQRDRWRSYLRADTRTAALDAAAEKNWSIVFGKPGPGAKDLTAEVATALKAGVWKSEITSRISETASPTSEIPSQTLDSSMTAGSKRN
ncbi:hypothetical protein CCAX7_51120 [Capsulimonas corticalis]|uniref:Uncharacterized protein n=1 Tax=Capsulimonas corticalis TaxID=2219043 RepID=A0A402CPB6_9BACT|nr:hypothetical protein [Capsulimonas corticalis]BDI33061.1 hypothetical protein CCAX7_51120 [Capsulimonas corticalis]